MVPNNNYRERVPRIAIGIILLIFLTMCNASAETITVNASVGEDYSRIQDAIDNASAGDEIHVYSSTYFENVNVTKQLKLRGIGNPVVDAQESGSAITLSADGITLEGFKAIGSGYYYDSPEAGIKVISSNNTLNGNNASNNYGSGIYLSFSSNNMLSQNKASNNYQGIYLSTSSNNILRGNKVSKNDYYGIYLESSGNNTLDGNNVSKNYDSGIFLGSSNNNTLKGNNASNNGNEYSNGVAGIYLYYSGNNTLSDNMMTGNKRNFNLDGNNDSDFDNIIDKSNLVDGKPIYYIIKATGVTYGSSSNAGTFYCISCINVTIKNLNLKKNGKGIYFWNTSQSRIQNVNVLENDIGLYLSFSNKNKLSRNSVNSNTQLGIYLSYSSNNTLIDNTANNFSGYTYYGSGTGIYLSYSNNNIVKGNNASNNDRGILLYSSSNNTLLDNNANSNIFHIGKYQEKFGTGIDLSSSGNNTLIGNNASDNGYSGISFSSSGNNTMSDNMMTGNPRNFILDGDTDSDFSNHIDKSNFVDGRPVYYIIEATGVTYDSSCNAGTLYCISCVNVTIKDLDLIKNGYGIYFRNTSQSRIQNVNTSDNDKGIYLSSSGNNTLIGNNASNNGNSGISFSFSGNNTIINSNAENNIYYGISLFSSNDNSLIGNNAWVNIEGIYLESSNNNTMRDNNASSNNGDGIFLLFSRNTTMSSNNVSSNNGYSGQYGNKLGTGIYLDTSSGNTIDSNNASSNTWSGIYLSHSDSSLMNGNNASNNYYGIYLSASRKNTIIGNNASNNWNGISLESSRNNTISGNNASNNWNGIHLSSSRNNTISGNNASNNWNGIYLASSSNNTLNGINTSFNNNCGIYLESSSNNNTIYDNIFNNTNNVYFYSKMNTWNTTRRSGPNIIGGSLLGGNFWANPNGKGFSQTCKDVNGDGICDSSRTLDANNIDYLPITKYRIPPRSISNLKNESYSSGYINWTWTDPQDPDFDRVKIYINNIYMTSVMKGVQYYKAKKLHANRSYTISTRTVDKSGNVNITWKNDTAWTKPDPVPPMNVTNLKNITYAKNYINWTWKDPKDNDFLKVMVFIDSKFKGNVSKGKRYYNATNFTANTDHSISTMTVDWNGNINQTMTNSSAWTAK